MHRIWALIGAALLVVGCSSDASSADADRADAPATTATSTPTTTAAPINRPPSIRVVPLARAEIGEVLSDSIVAFDPEGDDVVVRVGDGPTGFAPVVNARGRIIGFEWEPVEPGEWDVWVSGTDPDGLVVEEVIRLIARHPRSVDLVLAMGDSVAAGFGRDRSDFLGDDDCFRSEDDAYGLTVADTLADIGSLTPDSGALLVACTGATLGALTTDPVVATQRNGAVLGEGERSQLDWASDLNPTIVTLTIGATDLGLLDAEVLERLVRDRSENASVTVDLDRRLDLIDRELVEVLERLTTTTDAHIAITTYFDPTPMDPVGLDGCEAECFASAMAELYAALNQRILAAAATVDDARTSIVRLDEDDVWEAGNALGPDALREGLGPLQGLVDRFTGGGGAACADDSEPEQDLITALDCVHPNEAGHDLVASRVVDELLSL